jgi:hypothetical protein
MMLHPKRAFGGCKDIIPAITAPLLGHIYSSITMTHSELQIYRLQMLALPNRLDTDVSDLIVKEWWRASRGNQHPWFTFRFEDDQVISRLHLEGVPAGQRVSIFKVDTSTGEWLGLLATETVVQDGWVDLTEPIIMRTKEEFVAVPERNSVWSDEGDPS